jgi:predicted amidophosphoribosyltransferase
VCGVPPHPCCPSCRPKAAAAGFTRGDPGVDQLRGFSAAPYGPELSKLLSAYKDKSQLWLQRDLGDLTKTAINAALATQHSGTVDFLTYIGSSAANYRKRGYNPALELLRGANRELRLPIVGTLRPRGKVADQSTLSVTEREQNLSGALRPTRAALAETKRALLFDDVVTTGSTLRAASHALQEMNVEVVAIAVLADVALRRDRV